MLDASNSSGKVWADTAYRTKSNEAWLKANGFFSHIHRRKPRGKPMPEHIRRGDATCSIIRSCVEHVFGQEKGPMDLSIRTIGIERATTKMTLANLAYNMKPLIFHERRKTMAWLRPKSENHPFRRAKGPENNPNLRLPHKIHLWRGAPMNTRFIILKCKPSFRSVQLADDPGGNPDIRCAVLTGAGDKTFSAGADLKDDTGLSGEAYWKGISAAGYSGIALRQMTTPVIARVNGLALGGGLEMMLGCDIVIAAETARFALPEAKVGRVPLDGGMVLLPRLIPRNIAIGMMMTGRMVPASEMATYGLLNAVVPMDELDAETDRWAADLLNCAPLSLAAIKAVARQSAHLDPQSAYAHHTDALVAALKSEDVDEGVAAFREKRAPVWKGR